LIPDRRVLFAVALLALTAVEPGADSRDMYLLHTLAAGQSRVFEAVDGVKRVDLIGEGKVVASQSPADAPRGAHVIFPAITAHATWYSLVVEDGRGRRAYTDPIWIDTPASK
jgi:hypothetical protein